MESVEAPVANQDRVDATFVRSSKLRKLSGGRELVRWETGLPSCLTVRLPDDIQQRVQAAKINHHRFGQYSRPLDQIRSCLEHRALEKRESQRMCADLGIPNDFDIAQISWRPDYVPSLNAATWPCHLHFCETQKHGSFLVLYTKISKEDIRHNRDNVGEPLGFVGRVIHGGNPRAWLKDMRQRLGEKVDYASE